LLRNPRYAPAPPFLQRPVTAPFPLILIFGPILYVFRSAHMLQSQQHESFVNDNQLLICGGSFLIGSECNKM
jgi:hypothetical protein